MHIELFNPAECRFKFRGKNIAYLSARNTRNLAKNLGIDSEGTKLQVYERIVSHLDESGAGPVISEAAESPVLPEQERKDTKGSQEPDDLKRPAKKAARKPTRRRKATFL